VDEVAGEAGVAQRRLHLQTVAHNPWWSDLQR
jgi:hypothetical protein